MRWPKIGLGWFKSHQMETAAIVLSGFIVFYLHRKGAFATSAIPGRSMEQRMMGMVPSLMKPQPARMSQQEPERFTQFDHRFEMDRLHGGGLDFRTEFDDDERRRFLPQILSAPGIDIPLVEFLFGLGFNQELAEEDCILTPNAPGIWEIGTNGCWYQVSPADEALIENISRLRGDRHNAVIIQ